MWQLRQGAAAKQRGMFAMTGQSRSKTFPAWWSLRPACVTPMSGNLKFSVSHQHNHGTIHLHNPHVWLPDWQLVLRVKVVTWVWQLPEITASPGCVMPVCFSSVRTNCSTRLQHVSPGLCLRVKMLLCSCFTMLMTDHCAMGGYPYEIFSNVRLCTALFLLSGPFIRCASV